MPIVAVAFDRNLVFRYGKVYYIRADWVLHYCYDAIRSEPISEDPFEITFSLPDANGAASARTVFLIKKFCSDRKGFIANLACKIDTPLI